MRRVITITLVLMLLAGVVNAEVFGVKSSDIRTYTLMEIPTEEGSYPVISVHDRNYYYDDVKYYIFRTTELAKDNYNIVWDYINEDAKDKDLIERRNAVAALKKDFQYLKRDNGSSGYVRITFIHVIGVNYD